MKTKNVLFLLLLSVITLCSSNVALAYTDKKDNYEVPPSEQVSNRNVKYIKTS